MNGFISFSVTQLVVDENTGASFTTVQLPLIREVGTTGTVLATVDVSSICNSLFVVLLDILISISYGSIIPRLLHGGRKGKSLETRLVNL